MGSIRPTYIKRVALEIVKKHQDMVSDDFQANKELVSRITDVPTKKMRNRIAGYVTRYYKVTKRRQEQT